MSIKESQAVLKCFKDLKSSVWFTLGSEDETMFCDTWVLKTLNDRQSLNFTNRKIPANLNCHVD